MVTKLLSISLALLLTAGLSLKVSGQKSSAPFTFSYDGKTLHGLIESPAGATSKAVVFIIPGYGKTNFVEGRTGAALRDSLVAAGLTVCFWDKQGCGKSEGEFDAQQPVEDSAQEAIAAIKALKQKNIPGADKTGLWGLSRAGWICPLINNLFPVDFWISVSGTNDKENYGYLLRSNLLIAGKSEAEAERLYRSWKLGHKLYSTGGTYEAYVEATQPLGADSLCQALFGNKPVPEITEEDLVSYAKNQRSFTSKGRFDEASGLWSYIVGFDQMLTKFNCPVLAIFGANDSQVDWQLTKSLYEQTIGGNPKASLTTKVFEQCNHSIKQCETCAFREDLSHLNWASCPGYYTLMTTWLRDQGFTE